MNYALVGLSACLLGAWGACACSSSPHAPPADARPMIDGMSHTVVDAVPAPDAAPLPDAPIDATPLPDASPPLDAGALPPTPCGGDAGMCLLPPPVCADDHYVVYYTDGMCTAGECVWTSNLHYCPLGCAGGACH